MVLEYVRWWHQLTFSYFSKGINKLLTFKALIKKGLGVEVLLLLNPHMDPFPSRGSHPDHRNIGKVTSQQTRIMKGKGGSAPVSQHASPEREARPRFEMIPATIYLKKLPIATSRVSSLRKHSTSHSKKKVEEEMSMYERAVKDSLEPTFGRPVQALFRISTGILIFECNPFVFHSFFSCLNFAFLCNTEPKTKAKEAPADPEKGKVAEQPVESISSDKEMISALRHGMRGN